MRSKHIVGALVVVACLSFALTAEAGTPCPCTVDVAEPFGGAAQPDFDDINAIAQCANFDDCSLCTVSCDVNCDGTTDSLDLSFVLDAFTGGVPDCESPPAVGACCGDDELLLPTGCGVVSEFVCGYLGTSPIPSGTTYLGDDTSCTTAGECPSVPAVSEWAMVAMTLLVLAVGTVAFNRRRVA